jgi:hypothetical protein
MQQTPRKRRRPALSCIECRRRKIKCDRNDPCAHCVAVKTQCVHRAYHEPVAPQHPPQDNSLTVLSATSTLTSPSPAQDGIDLVVGTQQNRSSGLINPVATSTHQSFLDTSLQQNRPRDTESDVQQLIHRVQRLEQASVTSPLGGLAETGRDILERQAGLQDSQIVLNKTRILRWSHWMGTAQEVRLLHLHSRFYTDYFTSLHWYTRATLLRLAKMMVSLSNLQNREASLLKFILSCKNAKTLRGVSRQGSPRH